MTGKDQFPIRFFGTDFVDNIRNIIFISELDPEELQREALSRELEHLVLKQADLAPYLQNVLGLSIADPLVEARLKLLDAAMLQRQIHSALRAFFVALTELSVTVIILDDLITKGQLIEALELAGPSRGAPTESSGAPP